VIYTAVQIVRGLIIFALRVPPLVGTMIVKNNRPLIRERSVRIVQWLAVIIWILVTLRLFAVRQSLFIFIRDLLSWSVTIGAVEVSLGAVVLFFLTIWVAVLISRFLRFVLEEDVYPRVDLGGGVSYAVSTMLHYSILVLGFLIAVSVLGVDFTKFALIAGAVGIGIGFGLQNIINNFVSGLILLFERPVKVGDNIQIDTHMGSLRQIGLRASVLRKLDGSDVIVPNSRLISEEVTNWTLSDNERRIEIKVGVAYGSDPALVKSLLQKAASTIPDVLTDPPPRAIFTGFGDNSLDFELRAWTDDTDAWVALRSDIVTDIYARLNEAGVEFPFPQRDIHLRSIDKGAADEIKRRSKT
jgi:small-conductance mechanosensitive channel